MRIDRTSSVRSLPVSSSSNRQAKRRAGARLRGAADRALEQLESRRLFASIVWNPTVSSAWDHTTANWIDTATSAPTTFHDGDNVTFTDAGLTGNNVNIFIESGGVAPATATFNNNFYLGINGGGITGNATVTKNGTGLLDNWGSSHSYAGVTQINSGRMRLGNGSTNLPDLGDVVLGATGELQVDGNETIGSLAGSGKVISNGLTTGGNNASTNFSGVFTGVAFKKAGTGTMTLSGNLPNTMIGQLTINGGTLVLDKTPGVNAIPVSGTSQPSVFIDNGSTLRWNASNQVADAAGIVNFNGTFDLNGRDETIAAMTMDSVGALTTTGAGGHLVFTDTATLFRGTLAVNAGATLTSRTLNMGDGPTNFTGDIAGDVFVGAGGGILRDPASSTFTVHGTGSFNTSTANFQINSGSTIVEAGGVINVGTGGLDLGGAATVTLNSDSTAPGKITLGGTLGGAGGVIKTTASASQPGYIDLGASTRTLNITSNFINIEARILGAGGIIKNGAGGMRIAGDNTYTGATVLNGGYTALGSSSALGATSAGTTVANGLNLDLNGHICSENITFTGGGAFRNESANAVLGPSNGLNATMNGTLSIGGNVIITGNKQITINGNISGTGGITKDGGMQLLLGGNNTYAGSTTINVLGIEVLASAANGIPDSSAVNLTGGAASLKTNGPEVIGSLSGSDGVVNVGGNLTTGGNGNTQSFGGVMNVNTTNATLDLRGDLTFSSGGSNRLNVNTGNTLTVTNGGSGTLIFAQQEFLNGSLSVLGTVDHGANNLFVAQTLSGTGNILGSGTTFVTGSASIASPGAANGGNVGTLNTTSLNLAPSAKYNAQLNAAGDQLNVAGTATITNSTLVTSGTGEQSVYTLINNDGTDAVIGTFVGRPELSTVTVGGNNFKLTYQGGDGNDVVLFRNVPPVAVADAYSVAEDGTLTKNAAGGVLANDTDADGNTLSATLVSGPSHGTLSFSANGSFTYTPDANYNGPDSFSYKANDGLADSNVAAVSINVTEVNDAPTAHNDTLSSIDENSGARTIPFSALLANDSAGPANESGQSLTISAVGSAVGGTVSISGTNVIFTPTQDYNGPASFNYTVQDNGTTNGAADPKSDSAVVSFSINPRNNDPIATADSDTTDEDHAVTTNVLANDSAGPADEDQTLTITSVTSPAHGTVVLNANGTVTYTPNADFNGSDSYSYMIQDSDGASASSTVSITINPINDAPKSHTGSAAGDEDTAIDGTLSATDIDSTDLTFSIVHAPTHGTLTSFDPATGAFTYQGDLNFNGTDSFTFKSNDGELDSNTATEHLTVNAENDRPVANPDAKTTDEDIAVSGNVLTNDHDDDGDALTAIKDSDPTNGSVVFNADGTYTYTPNVYFNGSDSFTYHATDGQLDSAVTTVTITITPVNNAPIANDGSASGDEDTAISGTVEAQDVDNTSLTYSIVSAPSNGIITSFNAATGAFTYKGNLNFNGPDSFTFQASDGSLTSNIATETLTVNAVNDRPVAMADTKTTDEDTAVSGNVLANDHDVDGDALTAIKDSNPAHGSIVFNADGSYTYTPNLDYNGTDSFTYHANDGELDSSVVTVTITIEPVNDAPHAHNGSASGDEDTAISGVLSATDVDGPSITFSIVDGPSHGTITHFDAATGAFTYKGNQDSNGTDSFTFKASDGSLTSHVATESLTINAVNDRPVSQGDAANPDEDHAYTGNVLTNDSDVDHDALTAVKDSDPAHGSVVFNSDGTYTYTPDADFDGTDSFTYHANDGQLDSAVATVTITMTPVNDAPVAKNGSASGDEDTVIPGTVKATDVDNTSLTYSIVSAPSNGTITSFNASTGAFTYKGNLNFNGTDSFTFKASDGSLFSTGSFTINVAPVNDAPTVGGRASAAVVVNEADTATNNGTFDDVDGDPVTLTASEGTVTRSGTSNGTWTWSKATTDDEATHTVTITANDGHGGISTTTFTLKANNVAPTAVANTYTTAQGAAVTGNVITDNSGAGVDHDPAGANDPLTIVGFTQPANGTLVLATNGTFTYTPASTFAGADTYTYTISDGDGGTSTATVTINVGAAAPGSITTIPDTCLGGTALVINGTSGDDDIQINPGSSSSTLNITVNGTTTSYPRPSGRVIVFAGSGNDRVHASGSISNALWFYGDAGDDSLDAGNNDNHGNLLFGGDGNDDLKGGNGRDVMIAGQGADKLVGNGDDDIIVGGYTTKDRRTDAGHDEFWCGVMEEWSSSNTFQNRVHNLKNDGLSTQANHSGGSFLNATTLRDDTSIDQVDMLQGSSGNDWYIFRLGEDKVVGESTLEDLFDTNL